MPIFKFNAPIGSRTTCWMFDNESSQNTEGNIMKTVYSAQLLATVSNMKHLLEMHEIESNITGEFLSAAVGEIPATEAWPQLWVSDQDFERANKIIEDALSDLPESQKVLICPKCGEEVEGQFAECWNCGTSMN